MAATNEDNPVPAPSSNKVLSFKYPEWPQCRAKSPKSNAPLQTCNPTNGKAVLMLCSKKNQTFDFNSIYNPFK